jgi:pimeloyl-ACP methyl ester carboxylesterase
MRLARAASRSNRAASNIRPACSRSPPNARTSRCRKILRGQKGRQIELFVARVPAISLNKKPDPLFLIAGGPGTSAVDMYTSSAAPFDRVRRDRDIILLDQRGTGRSHRLDCDYGNQNVFERIDDLEAASANNKCRDELSKSSDLRMYTTSIAVQDLDTVRRALGYQRINLFGNSYGTRVAQHYARRFPAATRTLILDGVVNPRWCWGRQSRSTPSGRSSGSWRAAREMPPARRHSWIRPRTIARCARNSQRRR